MRIGIMTAEWRSVAHLSCTITSAFEHGVLLEVLLTVLNGPGMELAIPSPLVKELFRIVQPEYLNFKPLSCGQ